MHVCVARGACPAYIRHVRSGILGEKRVKISRNALCPCGSGKKYKHCCLKSGLYEFDQGAAGDASGAGGMVRTRKKTSQVAKMLGASGLLTAIGVGIWQNDAFTGIGVAAAWTLASVAYLSFRDPPPPNENAGDPAALNFGRPADRK
tara:strand:+ start:347 stop:787 length:441 start_codon:yes stop_codon:yes gene_type:complete